MHFKTLLLVSLASLAVSHPSANPNEAAVANNCGWPNGNCYDNNCHGELSSNRITCTSVSPTPPSDGNDMRSNSCTLGKGPILGLSMRIRLW
ncbi:hypothetical protein BDV41DRAFT_526935 [Aspergillus transmontanensis]|uniref:Uncharacterized protein n=1 Tax=Aspergillus transmontanensis TaxID=1034304 RepID=A0A5N6W8H4_9EURO|nr:hypothetical protein BDV41DRAFT_526935 [Aspergillus transmontanensis]